MTEPKIQVFIDKSPSIEKKACGNCSYFSPWGVHTGSCSVKVREKMDTQRCNRFKAKYKANGTD